MEEVQHEEDVVAMILELALVALVPNDNIWILDIGAMKHVIGNPKVLNRLCHGNANCKWTFLSQLRKGMLRHGIGRRKEVDNLRHSGHTIHDSQLAIHGRICRARSTCMLQ